MRAILFVAFAALAVWAEDVEDLQPEEPLPTPSQAPEDAEKHEFQTDVRKMLDIIINSLYTNRAVFLRELISNSADALEKVRFLYITNPQSPVNAKGEAPEMDVRISIDKDARTLVIRDGGIGMTHDDLVNNLGRIGASGTKAFLEQAGGSGASGDASFIGQFGVGFYSAFLAADRVRVASKSDGSDKQVVWESAADGEYSIYEDPRGNTLGRGTEITLHIKPDAEEFLDETRVKDIATKYSEFIQFPIFTQTTRNEERTVDVEDEEEAKEDADERKEDEEGEEKKEKKTKKETVTVQEWLRVNENQPIWTRDPSDVTEDQYKSFYRALTKESSDPLTWEHFSAEGEVEFKSILYVPSQAPAKLFETAAAAVSNVKLYVRRVFITDEFKDMLPRYLSFVTGVVDSDDLPLNVSRELLQESRVLKIIKKKLIRKILGMIKDVADKDIAAEKKWKDRSDDDQDAEKPEAKYPVFWKQYGKALRLGLIEDTGNRARLAKLLRYHSTKAVGSDEWRSLEEYVDGMTPEQKDIYYIISLDSTAAEMAKKPLIQRFLKKGVEVLLMDDALDEYVLGHMTEFGGKKLVNLAKEDVKVPGEDSEEAKNIWSRRKAANKDFTEWVKKQLGSRVEKVVLSERLVDAPAVVVSTKYGLTANMQNIMRNTPLGESMRAPPPSKVLELNINHPAVRAMRDQSRERPEDEELSQSAVLMYETAAFEAGFALDNLKEFISRMQASIGKTLGVSDFAPLEDEELPAEEQEVDEDEELSADDESPVKVEVAGADAAEEDASEEPATEGGSDEL
eukprot:TRINITY_DN58306_c0_g1_i1.p1 TRINITY_DN58306_c0_g1~~TRINITY_DN58306_c0_g1_i1.p1  ORF type:complete len:796 (-),score=318.64 TRINITY_DN58306_c0_g1_i1:171-2558(-)